MEKLPGILENAISKIEDISCPPDDKDNNQHSSSSSIARAEAKKFPPKPYNKSFS